MKRRLKPRRSQVTLVVGLFVDRKELVHLVHSQERDKDTINPIPHSVFKRFHYPKTGLVQFAFWHKGGRLGNIYLLWGNECKHAYFPLVAIAGPDWPTMVITYLAFIGITIFDCYVAMYIHEVVMSVGRILLPMSSFTHLSELLQFCSGFSWQQHSPILVLLFVVRPSILPLQ